MTKSQIISKIRRLHNGHKPLNVTAAKRHSPALVEAVYAQRPYWGWKRALKDAGIDYKDIHVDLLDHCVCRVCRGEYRILTGHLQAKHNLTIGEYLELYPGSELMAETTRAARTGLNSSVHRRRRPGRRPVLPHWEPILSREYLLDRIHEYMIRGYDINYLHMSRMDRGLAAGALSYFRSYDHALEQLGRNPSTIRKQRPGRHVSKEEVIEKLRARQAGDLPLYEKRVSKDDLQLMNAAIRRFGSYSRALRAAGMDPNKVFKKIHFIPLARKERLIRIVRGIAALKGAVRRRAVRRIYKDYKNVAYSKHFGSWRKVARAAGIPYKTLSKHPYIDRDSVCEALLERKRKGKPLSAMALLKDGKQGRMLYTAVHRYFGKFKQLQCSPEFRALSGKGSLH